MNEWIAHKRTGGHDILLKIRHQSQQTGPSDQSEQSRVDQLKEGFRESESLNKRFQSLWEKGGGAMFIMRKWNRFLTFNARKSIVGGLQN